ncbi:hypothetical protein Q4577_07110 [Marinovum sp. 2_MG-2023]|uniref:hypothetical protein n=1 Tax=unclassified Marinovum TaxID=2647166 RepID=UPI0026E43B8D|nr:MULTISPECIES: hypothetical protein [unclassified Marinovum]MDO6729781.1 hypothetical protein [Marinovum sp. 2_MG-2023]MDO6779595.1 hypothetical protein [Marinovum sp. 1_MG-2023]
MFPQSDLNRIVAAMRANGVTSLALRDNHNKLHLDLAAGVDPAPQTPAKPLSRDIKSPGIGRFSPRGGDDGLPRLDPATPVSLGEVLGYLGQGSVRLALCSPDHGALCGPTPDEGQILGFGDVLFTLEPHQ